MYCQSEILGELKKKDDMRWLQNCFRDRGEDVNDIIGKFAKQLFIDDSSHLLIPAATCNHPDLIFPHRDKSNPTDECDDVTLQIQLPVKLSDVDDDVKNEIVRINGWEHKHEDSLCFPVTFLLYDRKCTIDYSVRMDKIKDFDFAVAKEEKGRTLMRKWLMNVGGPNNYRIISCSVHGYQKIASLCKLQQYYNCNINMYIAPAAVDRMVS